MAARNPHVNKEALNCLENQLHHLKDGIYLKPTKTGLSNTALLYKSKTSTVINILTAIDKDEISVSKLSDRTRSTLYQAIWAGKPLHSFPVRWSKSTKWL